MASRARILATAHGTRSEAFGPAEWGLTAVAALVWGSSFLFIAIGIDHFEPGVVTFLRIVFGATALGLVRESRTPVDRGDWPRVAALSVAWMALPLTLFPIAEQWVDSSVAGMINGSTPLWAALIAAFLLRRWPGPVQVAGLTIGLAGVVAIGLPSVNGADASPLGVALVCLAVVSYGVAANLAVPLQQKYGALPVIFRTQWISLGLTLPYALAGVGRSELHPGSLAAVVALGALGTGVAYVALATLAGRVGATRGTIPVYLTPVVAIVLGVLFRDERVAALALIGTALVLLGAWLTSREEAPLDQLAPAVPAAD